MVEHLYRCFSSLQKKRIVRFFCFRFYEAAVLFYLKWNLTRHKLSSSLGGYVLRRNSADHIFIRKDAGIHRLFSSWQCVENIYTPIGYKVFVCVFPQNACYLSGCPLITWR